MSPFQIMVLRYLSLIARLLLEQQTGNRALPFDKWTRYDGRLEEIDARAVDLASSRSPQEEDVREMLGK